LRLLTRARGDTNYFGYNIKFQLTGSTNGTGDWSNLPSHTITLTAPSPRAPVQAAPPATTPTTEDQRHSGAWNMVGCDGHVSDSRRAYLFESRDDELLRRWNRDNLPHPENLPEAMR
jgi:hypothetical protein